MQDCPQTEIEKAEMENIPYRSVLGFVSFMASRTRPEISYAVNILSQYQENPGIKCRQALLKLLEYLQYTTENLDLSKISDLSIKCYTDDDHASSREDRVSIGGTIVYAGGTRGGSDKCLRRITGAPRFMKTKDSRKDLKVDRIKDQIAQLFLKMQLTVRSAKIKRFLTSI
ncbi:uncharacterized protein [Parasteatoda tepidariorum]|uniref:uncharacterized protein n=1 Tax=Parasteatoda tepidariorum TaxID=114398 RepID=UPI0039BD91E2